jgi:GTP-binding protein
VLFSSRADQMPEQYRRYLINSLRESFDLPGVPIRISVKSGKNPYDDDGSDAAPRVARASTRPGVEKTKGTTTPGSHGVKKPSAKPRAKGPSGGLTKTAARALKANGPSWARPKAPVKGAPKASAPKGLGPKGRPGGRPGSSKPRP